MSISHGGGLYSKTCEMPLLYNFFIIEGFSDQHIAVGIAAFNK